MELEDLIAEAVKKALAKHQAAFIEMAQKAIQIDRQGTGSRKPAEELTLESNPVEFLIHKNKTIKLGEEYTPEEQAVLGAIFNVALSEGMSY